MIAGFHKIPEAEYHADPCDEPSLSASIAHVLLSRSPKHAWFAHPKLNPAWAPSEPTKGMDRGSAIHKLLLEGTETGLVIVHADDWRTKDAKTMRDEARQCGEIPLLAKDADEVRTIVEAVRAQLKGTELADVFQDGDAELSALWQEPEHGGIWCRSRLDFLSTDRKLIVDLKCTEGSAAPGACVRRILDMGYDIQGAFYHRGVQVLSGVVPQFVLLVLEVEPPYALSMVGLKPAWLALAERQVREAQAQWATCLATGHFPGYPERIAWCDCPAYWEAQMMERELRDA
jgi:hypothetical protein